MPTQLKFSDADIVAVATELAIDLSSQEKIAVLKSSASCDIQAGPGCGKTTSLTAKLALLAKKWQWSDRGILVLSHTNVARREIESRLGQSKPLGQLLGYPHFIGTFQTFVDKFLALPFLRAEGIEVTAIDDEKFSARALSSFAKGPYWNARATLANRPEPLDDIVGKLFLDGVELRVSHPAEQNNRFPGPESKTSKELAALKKRMSQDGYFRFEDMFAYAEACLAKRKYLLPIIRHRFPWVLVDELQDTKENQDRILETIFATDGCVMLKFGDKNQAIFNFDNSSVIAPELFGRRPTLPLSETHRFGEGIARFASTLTVVVPQTLKPTEPRAKRRHTVFLFDVNSIHKVVPAFAELVLAEVPEKIRQKYSVCVVGGRKNVKEPKPKNFPEAIGDYWHGFRSDISRKPKMPDSFYGFVTYARSSVSKENSFAEPVAKLVNGVLEAIRCATPERAKASAKSRTELKDILKADDSYFEFKKLLWEFLQPDADLSKDHWDALAKRLVILLGAIMPEANNPRLREFLEWSGSSEAEPQAGDEIESGAENILLHSSANGEVTIRFDSIHGVKGETHAATLVVETFSRTHDIEALLPVLTGNKKATTLAKTAIGHCKRIFVGITRPTELVCLAIFNDHIDENKIELLKNAGWSVERLL